MYNELRKEFEEVTNFRGIDIKKQLKQEFGQELTFLNCGKEIRNSEFLFLHDLNLS